MKKLISIILSMLIVVSAIGVLPVLAEEKATSENFLDIFKANSTLAWNDEFEGNKVDETKWEIAKGWGRADETWSTQEDGNVTVSDGCLKLRAYEKATSEFTNGKAKTKLIQSGEVSSNAAWSEGLIEVRAKLPKGKGVYPAIWTMGRDYTINSCSWPWSGEIDIMEAVGTANKDKANCSTWQTLHTSRPFKKIGGNANDAHVATGVGEYKTPNEVPLNDDFHTFWCYMDGSIMIIGVDEYMMNIKDLNDPNLACFKDWEQWLVLGLQMGSLAGTPERTDFSVWEMLVDFVRVYRLEEVEDYSNYQIFEAENLEHSNRVTMNYNIPCAQKCVVASNSDMNLYLKDIEAGNYDVYVDYVGVANDGSYTAYFNGQRANTISLKRDYNAQMKYQKVGSITVEENTDFQLKFKRASGTLYLDKVFLVKTDNQSEIILNNANSITTSNCIEVANEEELALAISRIKKGGTIKFLNDIELTKNLILHHEMNVDFNGKTLTVNGGYLAIGEENKPNIIKNGNVIISGKSSNFINTTENNYNAKVKFEDLNITINSTASWGYVFNHNYGSIDIEANNCEFTFGEKVSNSSTYIIARNTGIYNNCTFNLNGRKAFLMSNGSNKSTRKLHLNNCVVNDALYLFHSDNALTQYVDVKLANTTLNNLGELTNHTENVQFVSVADNGTLKQNSETVSVSADMSGNFTMECNHSYVDADCTTPKHCEYCNLIEGKALGHISDGGKITRQADCYYSEITKFTCTKCGEVLEEKETAPIKGHDYTKELCGEQTCTTMRYYKISCKNCDYYYTDAADTDISGAYTYKGHTVDESTKVEFSSCVNHDGYYYTCAECGKENLKYIEHIGTHDIYSTNFTAPTETTAGSVTYKCNTCDFNKTRTIKAGEHIVTVDDVKYFTIDGDYFTPYQYDEKFMYYVDEDGKKYGSDALVQTDKDITLTKVTTEAHEHIPDMSAEKNVVAPTCGKEGYTEYSCTICSKTFKADFTPATGNHIADESKDKVVEPTCKEKGYTQRYCTVCKNTYKTDETAINPDAHNPQVSKAVESTCKENGLTEGSYCSWCNKILVAQEEIPKKPHTEFVSRKGYESTCAGAGYTDEISCSVCKTVIVERERLPILEHTEVIDMPREATCSQTGLTKGSHCSVCGEIIIAQVESPKTPHTIVVDRGFAATCEKAGLTNGKHCSVCGEITLAQKEIAKLPHIIGNWEIISESERVKKCLVCGEVVESEKITAICVHLTVIKNAKKATYFATGYTGDLVCIKCNKTITAGSITAKLTLKVPKFKLIKGKKQFKVKYTKVEGATGFQVRYKIKGKWKTKTFNTKKTATKVVKKLKKGNYQVGVRAMIVSGKQKAYSAWSKSKKVKVK